MNKKDREETIATFANRIKDSEHLALSLPQKKQLVNVLAGILAKSRRERSVLASIGAVSLSQTGAAT
jgi:hypothetical protein